MVHLEQGVEVRVQERALCGPDLALDTYTYMYTYIYIYIYTYIHI